MSSNEGPEEIIKMNPHYETGKSQLFTIKNCTHNCAQDQPDETLKVILGFFEGTIPHTWQPKDIGSFTPHPESKSK